MPENKLCPFRLSVNLPEDMQKCRELKCMWWNFCWKLYSGEVFDLIKHFIKLMEKNNARV